MTDQLTSTRNGSLRKPPLIFHILSEVKTLKKKKLSFDFSKTEGFQMLISKGSRTKMLRNKYSAEYLFQWFCFTSLKNGTCTGFLRSRGQFLESVSTGHFRFTSV